MDSESSLNMKDKIKIERAYYPNGKIEFEWPTLNGAWHGLNKMWYRNGVTEIQVLYVNGLKQGIFQCWFDNERRDRIDTDKDDNRHGLRIEFRY